MDSTVSVARSMASQVIEAPKGRIFLLVGIPFLSLWKVKDLLA